MSKDKALEIFEGNPEVEVVYITSDGVPFVSQAAAQWHRDNKCPGEIGVFFRQDCQEVEEVEEVEESEADQDPTADQDATAGQDPEGDEDPTVEGATIEESPLQPATPATLSWQARVARAQEATSLEQLEQYAIGETSNAVLKAIVEQQSKF
jgi:hypothetical protein